MQKGQRRFLLIDNAVLFQLALPQHRVIQATAAKLRAEGIPVTGRRLNFRVRCIRAIKFTVKGISSAFAIKYQMAVLNAWLLRERVSLFLHAIQFSMTVFNVGS